MHHDEILQQMQRCACDFIPRKILHTIAKTGSYTSSTFRMLHVKVLSADHRGCLHGVGIWAGEILEFQAPGGKKVALLAPESYRP